MKKITLLMAFVACVVFAQAQTLLTEDFNYTVGSDIKSQGWLIHSGSGATKDSILVTNGLTLDGYPGSGIGGAAALTGVYCDHNKTFTSQTAGVVYASFMMKTAAANRQGYFFHFAATPISSIFPSRVWVNSTGTGVSIGAFSSGTEPTNYYTVTPETTYLVVVKFDFTTKVSSLYISTTIPATEPSSAQATFTETANIANVGAVCLRQYTWTGATSNQNIIVDGIRVATSWAALFTQSGLDDLAVESLQAVVSGKDLLVKNAIDGSTVEIYSAVGSKVQSSVLENGRINLNDLSKGMYVVRVGKLTQKIML